MVHGHNEGHIAPCTDIEFQLTKYQIFDEILYRNIIIATLLTTIKQMALNIISQGKIKVV